MSKHQKLNIERFVIEVVKLKRKELKLSQVQLAEYLGMSEGFIGNVESVKYRAKYNLTHINAFAKLFKCSPKDFMPESPL